MSAIRSTVVRHPALPRRVSSAALPRPMRLAMAMVVAALVAAAMAWLTPRGPATARDVAVWMAVLTLLGVATAWIAASRWSLAFVPIAALVAFEIGRAGASGPTVDAVSLGSTYGIIALVVGRGVTLVVSLPSLMLGLLVGLWLAARADPSRAAPPGWPRRVATAAATLAVVLLATSFLRPASTAPVVGADGGALAGSIAELVRLPIGGRDQALMIRGHRADAPVLLHLAGGPGGTDIGAMRADTGLERLFVVVTWDQRGTGKSYASLDPVETLTLDGMVRDTIELTEHLRDRFAQERIYLTGNSWGSTLGVLAAQRRPDLYHAFIGTGQMVSQRDTDRMFWEDTLAWAERVGDRALAGRLRAYGPPPYADILRYEDALSHEHDWNPYPEFDNDREMPANLLVPENDLMDQVNGLRGFLDTFSVLYPQLQEIDFRVDVPSLGVPVYLVMGAHEARGRMTLARQWFQDLAAPAKTWVEFPHSGHRPSFEEPGRFVEVMERVLAETR